MSVRELRLPERLDGVELARIIKTDDAKAVFVVDAGLDKQDGDVTITWGILVADLCKHVANSLEGRVFAVDDNRQISREEILQKIRDVLDEEWKDGFDTIRRVTDS